MNWLRKLEALLSSLPLDGRDVLGINRRNRDLIERENPRKHRALVDDKVVAKGLMERAGVRVPRTIDTCTGLIEIEGIVRRLASHEGFVVKPVHGAAGRGVLVIRGRHEDGGFVQANGERLDERGLARHLAETVFGAFSRRQEDAALVEELVKPHPFFSELSEHGLCDVRLIVHRSAPAMAMVRVPLEGSGGRANLHAGGLGLGIDVDSGRIESCVRRGRHFARHPETGQLLTGRHIPHWSSIAGMGLRAAAAFPLGYVGVDIVLDHAGRPLVLEVNARSGLEIQNVCGRGLASALGARPACND